MGVSSEAVLAALRRAVEVSGVSVDVDDVIGRRKLELAIQTELMLFAAIDLICLLEDAADSQRAAA